MFTRFSSLSKYLRFTNQGDWFLHLINAFLVYAILSLLVLPTETTFIDLKATIPFLFALSFILFIAGCAYLLTLRLDKFRPQTAFVGLITAYLFLAIVKSPSLLITAGFFLLGFAVYAKLSWEKNKYRQFLPLGLLLTFPKVAYLVYHPAVIDLQRFVIDNSSWNINRIWMILLSILYAVCAYLLLSRLSNRLFSKALESQKASRYLYGLVGFLGLAYVAYLCIVSAYNVTTLSVSTFDIGIFTQMFESMKRDFSQVTTLERDKFMSHFGVHISPIYYLLLPFYYFFPYGETLEVLQVLVVFSGVIPLYLILKKMDFPSFTKPLILLWFFVTPALTTAGSYHLHENCFLVPLLLWLIYANIRQWKWRLGLIVLLTLMIKEDAFIYVVSIGLYFLLQKRFTLSKRSKWVIILSQLLFPILYFVACLFILNQYGEGAMVSRFDNFLLEGQEGLSKVLENIFLNPTYTFASFFTQAKLKYIFILFLTQAFLPILQREWANYFLFIPLVVINLLSDWIYQVDFGFQYSYGSNTLTLFLSILALEALWQRFSQKGNLVLASKRILGLISLATILSAGILYAHINGWHHNALSYFRDRQRFDDIQYTLSTIPRDKTVLAFHTYTVSLRSVPELYDIFYHNEKEFDEKIDIVVVPRSILENTESTEHEVLSLYLEQGYQEGAQSTEQVLILEKQNP